MKNTFPVTLFAELILNFNVINMPRYCDDIRMYHVTLHLTCETKPSRKLDRNRKVLIDPISAGSNNAASPLSTQDLSPEGNAASLIGRNAREN